MKKRSKQTIRAMHRQRADTRGESDPAEQPVQVVWAL
jgi:hypothetical protein